MLEVARTSLAIAIRCPRCGKLEASTLSRFACSRGRSVKISCTCGALMLTVGNRQGQVYLQVPCYLCDGVHFLYFNPVRFWGAELESIACAETDLQLGVFGEDEAVQDYARPGSGELERLLEDTAFDDYFDDREAMYQTLNRVHELAEEGKVGCVCGNHDIAVDLYPDHLELSCSSCGRHKSLPAGNEEDLAALARVGRIEVGEDTPNRRKGNKK